MNHEDLLKSFKAITDHIKKSDVKPSPLKMSSTTRFKSSVNGSPSKKTDAVPPSQSSQPTGSKWTLDALSKNIMAALNITPSTTAAIKDILGLPIKHQLTLLNAITER